MFSAVKKWLRGFKKLTAVAAEPIRAHVTPIAAHSRLNRAVAPEPTLSSLPDVTPVESQSTTVKAGHAWNKLYESHAKRQAAYRQRKRADAEAIAAAAQKATLEKFMREQDAGKRYYPGSLMQLTELTNAVASVRQQPDTVPVTVEATVLSAISSPDKQRDNVSVVTEGIVERENREIAEILAREAAEPAAPERAMPAAVVPFTGFDTVTEFVQTPPIDWEAEMKVFDESGSPLDYRDGDRLRILFLASIGDSIKQGLNTEAQRSDLESARVISELYRRILDNNRDRIAWRGKPKDSPNPYATKWIYPHPQQRTSS